MIVSDGNWTTNNAVCTGFDFGVNNCVFWISALNFSSSSVAAAGQPGYSGQQKSGKKDKYKK